MKKVNIAYWIVTGLFAAFMLFSGVQDARNTSEVQTFMHGMLGYPNYIAPFLGWAKILGSIAILIPGFPRLKEWAYAGLVIDLVGATYSTVAVNGVNGGLAFMLVFIAVAFISYALYHKKNQVALSKA